MDTRVVSMSALGIYLLATALFLCAGESSAGEPVEVVTSAGATALLPCRISLSPDQDLPSVEWSKDGLKPNISFLYRVGCETFEEKNAVFRYRTSLLMDQVKHGNLSLRMSDVRTSDAGIYKCRSKVKSWREIATVELVVVSVSEPTLSLVANVSGGVTLQCEAICWFPEPQMTFVDSQEKEVNTADQKSRLDPVERCFNVTRRLTVQTADRFVCRVHYPRTKQTRSTEIYIPDACVRSCIPSLAIAVTVCIIICAFAFALTTFLRKKCGNSGGEHKCLSQQSSVQSSTCSPAGGVNPVQNTDYQNEVQGLTANLREKEEIIRRLNEELDNLRSQQELVKYQDQPTVDNSPSESSPDVSIPPGLLDPLSPKPAASNTSIRSKSFSSGRSKDPKPSHSIPSEGSPLVRSKSLSASTRVHFPKHPSAFVPGSRYGPLANMDEEEVDLLS